MEDQSPVVSRSQNGTIVALRATHEEKAQLKQMSALAGMNVSNFIRHKIFGGRPIVASVDMKMLGELRRFAGLLKYQCQLFREQGGGIEVVQKLDSLYRDISQLISRIGIAYDSQKDQD